MHTSETLPVGTLKRAPSGFAHAIKLQQPTDKVWYVIDAYGGIPFEPLLTDKQVVNWSTVYIPKD